MPNPRSFSRKSAKTRMRIHKDYIRKEFRGEKAAWLGKGKKTKASQLRYAMKALGKSVFGITPSRAKRDVLSRRKGMARFMKRSRKALRGAGYKVVGRKISPR